ncbi:hypothetical protein GQ55_3G413500 [Panicum hallii var. hallii]|uniref:Late embryogenesis abundant protein LEA-2 subgroup domain-containing protein n=1 Tax=Panicum hallii var. hallii TaxID=1504633 RepID=A0A2T7EH89_9POAL|nr:hypothetical protein GQ55_3G413500 [Panicum hallii var. hallii]
MAADDAVGRKSAFRRGLNATRLAVASAVTVLIVLIVAYAVTVVTRTEELSLSVTGGIIYVMRESVQPRKVGLSFSVQANNPSGRARFYYTGIHGLVFPVNNRTKAIARFSIDRDMVVAPKSLLQTEAYVHVDDIPKIAPYFDELYNSSSASIFSNAMLTLNGTLEVGLYSVHNKSRVLTVYYCSPLTMGAAGNASAPDMDDNVPCGTSDPME